MLSDSNVKSIKVKLAKAIELIVKEQHKEHNSKLCEIQLRLETIYDTLDNSTYKRTGIVDYNTGTLFVPNLNKSFNKQGEEV